MTPENKQIKEKYLQLYKSKDKALDYKIDNEKDELKKVDFEIEQFYVQDTYENLEVELNNAKMGTGKITITKEESDKAIDAKTKKYNKIIGLLARKRDILIEKIKGTEDDLDRTNMELEVMSLDAEILAKKSFMDAWIERKKVIA